MLHFFKILTNNFKTSYENWNKEQIRKGAKNIKNRQNKQFLKETNIL